MHPFLNSQHVRPHWLLFLLGTPSLGLQSSCHSRWAHTHLLAVGTIFLYGLFCRENILLYSCLYHKGENKIEAAGFQKNGGGLPCGHKDHSYKIRHSTKCVWAKSVAFPVPSLMYSFLALAVQSSPWSRAIFSVARICCQEGRVGCGLLSVGLGKRGGLRMSSSGHLLEAVQEPISLGSALTGSEWRAQG